MANQLIPFWQGQQALHESNEVRAKTDQDQATREHTAAKDDQALLREEWTTLEREIAETRRRHAAANVPSDAAALLVQLTQQVERRRRLQGKLSEGVLRISDLEERVDEAKRRLARATKGIAMAKSELGRARTESKKREDRAAELRGAELAGLPAEARAFLQGTDALAAKSLIDVVPDVLRTLAIRRYKARLSLLKLRTESVQPFRAASMRGTASDAPVAGGVEQAQSELRKAEAEALEFATTARKRFDRAVTTLKALAARHRAGAAQALLTAAEQADVAITDPRRSAADAATEITKLLEQLVEAERELDHAWEQRVEADVDTAAGHNDVAVKRDALNTKRAELDHQADALDRAVLDRWQVTIPDAAWTTVLSYVEAVNELEALAAANAERLATALGSSEAAWTNQLEVAQKSEHRQQAWADAIAVRERRAAAAAADRESRLLSALRGDTY
jgi:hypothetical protein